VEREKGGKMKIGAKNDRYQARNANDYVDTPEFFLERFSPPIFFSGIRHVKFFTISPVTLFKISGGRLCIRIF